MTKSYPLHRWDKPAVSDRGYTIRAGTPSGPRSDRPSSDVLMIGSTSLKKRSSSELTGSAKKRKTIEKELKMKLKAKSSSSSSRYPSKAKMTPVFRAPRTPVKPIRSSATHTPSSKSDDTRERAFRWFTPPSPPATVFSSTASFQGLNLGAEERKIVPDSFQDVLLSSSVRAQDATEGTAPPSVLLAGHKNSSLDAGATRDSTAALAEADRGNAADKIDPYELNGALYKRNKERAAADSKFQFKVAVCPSYDLYGDPCKARKCPKDKRCSFAHPEDEEWQNLLKSGTAKTRMELACPHYDDLGNPKTEGGCPNKDHCPFYHPWHTKWLKLRGDGTSRSPKLIKCNRLTRKGEPLNGKGCWYKSQGRCNFVHPDSKNWDKAVSVMPSPSSNPEFYEDARRGKGIIRSSAVPSWMRPLPFSMSQTELSRRRSVSLDGYDHSRHDVIGRRASGSLVAIKTAQDGADDRLSGAPLETWVSNIREGIVADAAYTFARDALARHDAFVSSGVAPTGDLAVLKESKQLTAQALATREALEKSLAALEGSTTQVIAACTNHASLACQGHSEDHAFGNRQRPGDIWPGRERIGTHDRIRSLEQSVARQKGDMADLVQRLDDNARLLKTRSRLSERIYELEDDLKHLKSLKRKEKQGLADQMLDLQKDIRDLRRSQSLEGSQLKSQLRRELVAEFQSQFMMNQPGSFPYAGHPSNYPFAVYPFPSLMPVAEDE